jgi:hypothetical protein
VKFNFNFADFGKRQTIVGQRESALGKGEGIISLFVLETRKACFLFSFHTAKESPKRFINSFQNVLRNLAVNVFIFGISFFNFLELIRLVVVIQRDSVEFVGITTFLQTRIKQITAKLKRIYEFGCLCLTRKNAEFICFCYNLISHFAFAQFKSEIGKSWKGISRSFSTRFYFTTNTKQNTQWNALYPPPNRNGLEVVLG